MFDESPDTAAVQAAQEAIAAAAAPESAPPQESPIKEPVREYNMRTLRERAEAAERKAQELERQMQARTSQPQSDDFTNHVHDHEDDDEIGIGDAELLEGKDIKKIIQSERKRYDQKLQKIQARATFDSAERNLKDKYKDLEEVVSDTNLKNFKALYPEEFSSMMSNPDPYAKMKTAYTLINNLGIIDKQQTREYREIDRRIEENKSKPRAAAATPTTTASDTPLSRVADYDRRVLTEEMKEKMRHNLALAKEAIKYSRREF